MTNQKDNPRLLTPDELNEAIFLVDEETEEIVVAPDSYLLALEAQVAKCDKEWVEKLKDIRYLAQTYQNDQIIKVINKALKRSIDDGNTVGR